MILWGLQEGEEIHCYRNTTTCDSKHKFDTTLSDTTAFLEVPLPPRHRFVNRQKQLIDPSLVFAWLQC